MGVKVFLPWLWIFLILPGVTSPIMAREESFDYLLQFAKNQAGEASEACESTMCRTLKRMIDEAQDSIDFAIYGIRKQNDIKDALFAARLRGVRVRGFVDSSNRLCGREGGYYYDDTASLIEGLGGADIVRCDNVIGFSYIMHNKFFIFDQKKVWTGSTNISDTGTGGELNSNLALILSSPSVARTYGKQFDELYHGGSHRNGTDNTRHFFSFDDNTKVELYFSPTDDALRNGIHSVIDGATSTLDIMMFFLTDVETAWRIAAAERRGVRVRLILDHLGSKNEASQHKFLCKKGVDVKIENWPGKMHMKAAVADSKSVVLGSQNWTRNGNEGNDENTLVIHNEVLATSLQSEFNRLWKSLRKIKTCQW